MILLGLDTCLSACSVAILRARDNRFEFVADLCEPMTTGHAERLVPMLEEALQHAGFSMREIDRLVVTHGPGSFTGARIGVACARGLALATGMPVVSVSSFEVAALGEAIGPIEQGHVLAVAVRTGKSDVYVQTFGGTSRLPLSQPQLLPVADASNIGGKAPIVFAGSAAPELAQLARARGCDAESRTPTIQPRIVDILPRAFELQPLQVPPRPLYLRPPDAKPQSATIPRGPHDVGFSG